MDNIQVLRDRGLTFSQIGAELGISKDAAQKRHRRLSVAGQTPAPDLPRTNPDIVTRVWKQTDLGQGENLPTPQPDRPVHPTGWVGLTIAHFDIETTSLDGAVGRLLCACIADNDGNVETFRATDYARASLVDDSGIAVALRNRLEEFDILSGWNSKLFDVPFLNARLMIAGERPIQKKLHVDSMWYATGASVRVGRRSLENVAKVFNLPQQKEGLDKAEWALAIAGDQEAIERIVAHCQADVLVTRLAFAKLKVFIGSVHK